jgi:hypothetical protein
MSSKVTAVGDLFQKQMTAMAEYASKEGEAGLYKSSWPLWYTPEMKSWSGDVFKPEDIAKLFERKQHEEEFDKAVADASDPGTSNDLIVSTLQGDMLASMDRSYRGRLRTSARNKAHAAARRRGHGHEDGTIKAVEIGYIERSIKQSTQ